VIWSGAAKTICTPAGSRCGTRPIRRCGWNGSSTPRVAVPRLRVRAGTQVGPGGRRGRSPDDRHPSADADAVGDGPTRSWTPTVHRHRPRRLRRVGARAARVPHRTRLRPAQIKLYDGDWVYRGTVYGEIAGNLTSDVNETGSDQLRCPSTSTTRAAPGRRSGRSTKKRAAPPTFTSSSRRWAPASAAG
jgi:hypothetical protein